MTPSIRSRVIASGVAFLLGFAIANIGIIAIPAPDHRLWIAAAAVLIVTAGAGVVFADTRRGLSVWALLGIEVFVLFTLLPVLWLFTLATTPSGDTALTLWPQEINWEAFGTALDVDAVAAGMRHSVIAALIATAISIPVAVGAAHTLVRTRPPGHRYVRGVVTAVLLAPLLTWAVPMAQQVRELGVVGSPLVTALGYLVITVPLAIWMLIGVFEQVRWDLVESVRAAGVDQWGMVRKAWLPHLAPGVLATSVTVFAAACLDFVVGAGVTAGDGPLPASLLALSGDASLVAAVGVLWLIPLVVLVGLFSARITRIMGRS